MKTPAPLPPHQLYQPCSIDQFTFSSTQELNDFDEIIGQDRAVAAIRFGVGIRHEGFNLFALGANGTGKRTAVMQYLRQRAKDAPPPFDWCYVHNFKEPHKPRAIDLPAGQGRVLQEDMKRLVTDLATVLPAALASDDYNTKKKSIIDQLKAKENQALDQLKKESEARGIGFLRTANGIAFTPLKDGDVMGPEEFLQLPEAEREKIEAIVADLQDQLQETMQLVPQWHREAQKALRTLHDEAAELAIAPLFAELTQKYTDEPDVLAYLAEVKVDIVASVDDFLDDDQSSVASIMGMSAMRPQKRDNPASRYEVNVIVDHSETEGAPLIYEDQPTYNNLVGRTEHVAQMGAYFTDFTLIKPGVLHRANGGYLVLDVRKLLLQPYAWEGLKRALRAREIRIESLGQIYTAFSTVSLEPEPIPLDIKVVLLGERLLYYLLYQHDPDFRELFKVAADFEDEMARSEKNNMAYAQLISALARKEALLHFDRDAVARVIEYSARIAGDAEKLSTHMQTISDVLREASFWATEAGHELVTRVDVQQALDAQFYRNGRLRERIQEQILRERVLIDTDGAVVGQINGLSVYLLGHTAFGKPSRITARVRLGKGEIIDIERQVEMGGPIHSKGVLILAGFLGARYAAERPFAMNGTIVFEQSYGGVDGDSASSAELYALLSALAELPVRQSLAVTGSINQHGQVQAIGGVNEKIEGFFDVCRARGLTGDQGVLIPQANVNNLMLRQEVIDAAEAGQFHVYPISHVDEGIALLTGMTAGTADDDGRYPADSVNGRIIARLERLAEKQKKFSQPSANGERLAAQPAKSDELKRAHPQPAVDGAAVQGRTR